MKLLTREYEELTLEERVNAIRLAEQEGESQFRCDEDPDLVFRPLLYFFQIIEPAFRRGEINEKETDDWETELKKDEENITFSDPRVAAYARGWNRASKDFQYELELEDYESLEALDSVDLDPDVHAVIWTATTDSEKPFLLGSHGVEWPVESVSDALAWCEENGKRLVRHAKS